MGPEPEPTGQRDALALNRSASHWWERYWSSEDPADLDAALELFVDALAAARGSSDVPPEAVGVIANNLGRALESRFDRDSRVHDLLEAISCYEQAMTCVAPRHVPAVRGQLAVALRKHCAEGLDEREVSRAVDILEELVLLSSEDATVRSDWLRELSGALLDRYELAMDATDLQRSVELAHEALRLSGEEREHGVANRTTLGNALLTRYEHGRKHDDLVEAVETLERSHRLAAADSGFVSAATMSGLAGALMLRWDATGDEADLDRSIELYEAALESIQPGVRSWPGLLNNLGTALDERFHARGAVDDLDRAIDVYQRASDATPSAAADRIGRLNNLAIALRTRHLRATAGSQQARVDLERALHLHREALDLAPERSAQRAALLSSLGGDLRAGFDADGEVERLVEAVGCFERAVELAPVGSAERPMYLNNLGAALAQYGVVAEDLAAVSRAVDVCGEAVEITPPEAPELSRFQLNLANALTDLSLHAPELDPERARRAAALYRTCAERALVTAPEDALAAALNWSEWAADAADLEQVVEAAEMGSAATSILLAAQVLRAHQESWLRDAQGLASRQAWALVGLERAGSATLAVESGRAVLLSETLQRDHARIDDLVRAGHVLLANQYRAAVIRFETLRRQVDLGLERVAGVS